MTDSYWLVRFGQIVAKMWFNPKVADSINKTPTRFIIMCHGCPSHPYDRNPALNQRYLNKGGFVLVYSDYIGTWASYGQCNFENSVETVLKTIDFLNGGTATDLRSGEHIKWVVNDIVLMGGSFGGSVVLVAGAKSKDVRKIIAASPVTDWRTHNKIGREEEDLTQTWGILEKGFENCWRVKREDYFKLVRGELDLNPVDYIDILKDKDVFLIHGRYDKQVSCMRSNDIYRELKRGKGKHQIYLTKKNGHIVLRHLGQLPFYKKIAGWLYV